MQDRGPAQDSSEDTKVSGEQPTLAATPPPTLPASPAERPRRTVEDWTGREVAGRYTVLERLGEGGMGVVYVAEHLHLKKKVAFKVIHPQLAAHEELLLRFKREALATGQLDHPHIAAAIDFGELEDGGAFMVMPWVRGHSLQVELEKDGHMDYRRAAKLCAQIADALSAAHAMGIVHRDLKPDNVLLERRTDGSESAKVLDFGVASLAGGGGEGTRMAARPLTQAGTILGTPGYMSPEQASAGEIDHRTDLYALGVILWELCRGERLFDGDDVTAIFAKQFNSVPPPLELGRSGVARELTELVTRLLAWDKSQRPGSAAEVRDALKRIAEAPDSLISSVSIDMLPGIDRLPPTWRRYVPHALGALAILLVLVVWSGGDEPAPVAQEPAAAPTPAEPARPERAKRRHSEPPPERPAAAKAEPPPEKHEPPPVVRETVSEDELRDAQETLLRGRNRDQRRGAAKRVLKGAAGTPRYMELVADLELASSCAEKKDVLGEMRELADPRVLPALERLAETPRRGCGLIRLNDCLGCLRRDLDQTIGALAGGE